MGVAFTLHPTRTHAIKLYVARKQSFLSEMQCHIDFFIQKLSDLLIILEMKSLNMEYEPILLSCVINHETPLLSQKCEGCSQLIECFVRQHFDTAQSKAKYPSGIKSTETIVRTGGMGSGKGESGVRLRDWSSNRSAKNEIHTLFFELGHC